MNKLTLFLKNKKLIISVLNIHLIYAYSWILLAMVEVVRIEPIGGTLVDGSGPCPIVDCVLAISNVCPSNKVATNKDGQYVGCYSACEALRDPKYCCTGDYSSPQACQPNEYSTSFKKICNLAHFYPQVIIKLQFIVAMGQRITV